MNKTVKRILIGLSSILGVVVVFAVISFIRIKVNVNKLTPSDTKQVTEDVFVIKDDYSNMYLVKDGDSYIAIDACNTAEGVAKELSKLNIKPKQISAVLLTHSDADHVGALSLFPDAEVYLSEREEQMIIGQTSRVLFIKNKIHHKSYKLIPDGDEFKIGNIEIEGILTPGHTPGSMCYLINNKYLFTGDALGLKDSKVVGFNKVFNMNTVKALISTNLVTDIDDVEFLLTAHHGYTNNYNLAVREWNNR